MSSGPNWVYKLKYLPDGTPGNFKARLCVRDKLQKKGVNYCEKRTSLLVQDFYYSLKICNNSGLHVKLTITMHFHKLN